MTDTSPQSISPTQIPTIANGYRMQFEEAQDTWVLLYPEGMVKLNPSAAQILKRCDGATTVEDIITTLETTFETTGLSNDVHSFLNIAREQHWITFS